jgi:hypothetical protein
MRNKLFLYCVFILFNFSAWAQPQPRAAAPWTWEQVRQRFQDNNPTLLAGKLTVVVEQTCAGASDRDMETSPDDNLTLQEADHD